MATRGIKTYQPIIRLGALGENLDQPGIMGLLDSDATGRRQLSHGGKNTYSAAP